MLDFELFRNKIKQHIDLMLMGESYLFVTDTDKDEMYNLYLDSWPEGTNPLYRERRFFDCSACRSFIKNFGNVVKLSSGVINTIWDLNVDDDDCQTVLDALSLYVKSKAIRDVFVTKDRHFGVDNNIETLSDGIRINHPHFQYTLPNRFVYTGRETLDTERGRYRDIRNVFKRSLNELSVDSVTIVLELISQNSLYRGEEWKSQLEKFRLFQCEYNDVSMTNANKELYAWEKSIEAGVVIGKIRNHSIGTLLIDLTEDMDLEYALKRYEKVVAPTNYKRPDAVFTKKMIEDAEKTVEELGYDSSLSRRYATLEDITVNNILFVDKDAAKVVQGAARVFDKLSASVATTPKKFDRAEEITIDDFIQKVLPTSTGIEILFENRLNANMVSLIAPQVKDSKTMFKWNNNFSWAYAGNITDSFKDLVQKAGGSVTGVLRFSIKWNDLEEHDGNDEDAHCQTPANEHIYFSTYKGCNTSPITSGVLDIDIVNPKNGCPAIENITFPSLNLLKDGDYKFWVHCYTCRGGTSGFAAEIEFDGQIYSFEYRKPLRQGQEVEVAIVNYNKVDGFTIKAKLSSNMSSKDIWGVKTNTFVPVSTIMYSPNYWDEQIGNGNRHVFFMLKNCINTENPNGFFNEYLDNELMKHKRVFEALGSEMRVQFTEDQLSGIGFSTTQRNNVICKVIGSTERILKVVF